MNGRLGEARESLCMAGMWVVVAADRRRSSRPIADIPKRWQRYKAF